MSISSSDLERIKRNEIIEECALIVDQCNREGPYQAIGAAGRIRQLKSTVRQAPHSSSERIRTAPEGCPQCFDASDCSNIDVCRALASSSEGGR